MHVPRKSVSGRHGAARALTSRAATARTLAAVFSLALSGLLTACSGPSLQDDAGAPPAGVERPHVEAPAQPFGSEIGSATFTHFLEGDLSVAGSVHIGPPVAVEAASELHASGARVIPVAYFSLVRRGGDFISQGDGMYYRAAGSTEPFRLKTTHREVTAEVLIRPRESRTWEEVRQEDDLLITVTGSVVADDK